MKTYPNFKLGLNARTIQSVSGNPIYNSLSLLQVTVAILLGLSLNLNLSAQNYQVDWGHDLFGTALPDGQKVDSSKAFYTYVNGNDSVFLNTYAETRSVAADRLGNTINVSDYLGSYYTIVPFKQIWWNPSSVIINKRDPQGKLLWSKQLTGTDHPIAWTVITDTANNIILCGQYRDSLDLDPDPLKQSVVSSGGVSENGFLIKLDPNGKLLLGINIHSTQDLRAYDVQLDKDNNIYVVGDFEGAADFDPGPGTALDTSRGKSENLFVVKYNAQGKYLWHHVTNTSKFSRAYCCSVDDSGAVYVAGEFSNQVDFSGTGTDTRVSAGSFDAFIFKLDSSGNYRWARNYGTKDLEYIRTMALKGNQLVVSGYFQKSLNLDSGATNTTVTTTHGYSSYVQRISPQGTHLWADEVGDGVIQIYDLAISDQGETLLAGKMNSTSVFNLPGGSITLNNQKMDWLLLSIDSNNQTTWARSWSSPHDDWINDVEIIGYHSIALAGTFRDQLFLTPPSGDLVHGEGTGYEGLVVKLSRCVQSQALNITACSSYTSPSGNHTWSKSGSYTDTLYSPGACDTLVTVNLLIHPSDSGQIAVQQCDSFRAPSGKIYTQSGTYYDSLSTAMGCDSLLTIQLSIFQPTFQSLQEQSCSQYTLPSGSQTLYTSGVYQDTLTNVAGCDSVLTITVQIEQPSYDTLIAASCDEYTFPSGRQTVFASGWYTDTLSNIWDCDSLLSIDLKVNPTPDTSVLNQGDSLVALASGIRYQWLRCDSGYQVLAGDTLAGFLPPSSGSYALSVEDNGCMDTSLCHAVLLISGLQEFPNPHIRIYPNPVTGESTQVELPPTAFPYHVRLFDPLGQLCWESEEIGNFDLPVPEMPGVYFLQLQHPQVGEFGYRLVR